MLRKEDGLPDIEEFVYPVPQEEGDGEEEKDKEKKRKKGDKDKDKDAEEEEVKPEVPLKHDMEIFPRNVITLIATEEFLKKRIEELPEEERKGNLTQEEFTNNWRSYQELNAADDEEEKPVIQKFFAETNGVDVLEIVCDEEIHLEGEKHPTRIMIKDEINIPKMHEYLAKDGEYFNYLEKPIDEDQQEEEAELEKQTNRELKDRKTKEKLAQEERESVEKEELLKIIANEKEILDIRSQPLRQYLADNIIPKLTKGLIKLSKEMPENPIDALVPQTPLPQFHQFHLFLFS